MAICSAKCSKTLLIFFNLTFWVAGCVIIGVGTCILVSPSKAHLYRVASATYDKSINSEKAFYIAKDGINNVAYALLVIGVVIVFSGFLGCCGVIQDRKFLMVAYFICLFVLLCAELSLTVVTMVYREKILSGLQERMSLTTQKLYAKDTTLTNSLDYTQFKFQCCGSQGGSDYKISKWKNTTSSVTKSVPLTCCPLINVADEDAYLNPKPFDERSCQDGRSVEVLPLRESRYEKGCYVSLEAWFRRDTSIIIGFGIGMAILQIFGMVMSVCLCRTTEDLV